MSRKRPLKRDDIDPPTTQWHPHIRPLEDDRHGNGDGDGDGEEPQPATQRKRHKTTQREGEEEEEEEEQLFEYEYEDEDEDDVDADGDYSDVGSSRAYGGSPLRSHPHPHRHPHRRRRIRVGSSVSHLYPPSDPEVDVEVDSDSLSDSHLVGNGLRPLSVRVCATVRRMQYTTYAAVADELVADTQNHNEAHSAHIGGAAYDDPESTRRSAEKDKNIRRRVYDALNVLMAIDVIAKSTGKEIEWRGMPNELVSQHRA